MSDVIFSYTWEIKNFSSNFVSKENNTLESPKFVIKHKNYLIRDKWFFKLYANGYSECPDDVYVVLCRNSGTGIIIFNCSFELVDSNDKVFQDVKIVNRVIENYGRTGQALIKIESLKNIMKSWTEDVLTVRCLFTSLNYHDYLSSEDKARTVLGMDHTTFAWQIEEPDSNEWFRKKIFCTGITSLNVLLTLLAEEIVIEVKNETFLRSNSLCVIFKIAFLDASGVEQGSMTDTYVFDNANLNIWKFPTFISRKALKEKNCIRKGFFTLILEFTVPNGVVITENGGIIKYKINPEVNSFHCTDATTTLHNNLKQMFLDKMHSDVTLKVGEQQFSAHKSLLSSRSPVFRAMFDCEMLESQTNIVEINDVDSETVNNLLEFLYSGKFCRNNCDIIINLMLAAEKYQVESLTEQCAKHLMSLLCQENLYKIISVADLVKHKILKVFSFEFIEEHASDILTSNEWSVWAEQNIKLASEIFSNLALKYKK